MRNFGAKPIVIAFRFKKHIAYKVYIASSDISHHRYIAPSVYRVKRTYDLSFILLKKHNLYDSMIYKEII